MAVRAQKLQRNGLMWALESKETDHDVKLAKEYQVCSFICTIYVASN